jgi:hypothetical protein
VWKCRLRESGFAGSARRSISLRTKGSIDTGF